MPPRGLQQHDPPIRMGRLREHREARDILLHMLAREEEEREDTYFRRPVLGGLRCGGQQIGLR